jgi:fructose-specific PTS system IIC-like component
MIGSAIGCSVAAIAGAQNMVAWGGLIVLPAVTGKLGYLAAIVIGSVSTALIVNLVKKPVEAREAQAVQAGSGDVELSFD